MSEPSVSDEPAFIDVADVYADLGGVAEVAQSLGVKVHRVRRWIERRETTHCPAAVRTLANGNIYSLVEWRGWFALWKLTRGSETWNRQAAADPASGEEQPGGQPHPMP